MYTEFQNAFKKQAEKIISKVQQADELFENFVAPSTNPSNTYSKTPQKFTINGREIEEKKLIAEGAFGFIWRAEDTRTKEQFALKRVICKAEDKVQSALLEKSILQKLPDSPYIVKYYGGLVFKHEENTVIVTLMELCPGGNLFDMLQKMEGKGLPEDTLKQIASSVLQGLSVLHKVGLIHRDIKIQNVIIGKDRRMKICDFGSCTTEIVDFSQMPKSQYDHAKQSMQAFTTPMYRPPEIVDPYLKYKVSFKADLWMLGCTLYTMAYFTHPFLDASAVGIAGAVYRFPSYPSETKYKVSDKMQDFIRNLLTPNPQFRPSAEKMLQILNKWDDLAAIPLNQDAKRIKKEHLEKQQERAKLNQKVVKYDGDIPLDELMKLQQKLQGTTKQNYEKQKVSFINDRQTQKISQGAPVKQPSLNKSNAQKQVEPCSVKVAATKDIWGDAFSSVSVKKKQEKKQSTTNQSFDAFNDIFSSVSGNKPSPKPQASSANNPNFHQFFDSYANPSSTNKPTSNGTSVQNASKKEEVNLLDL